MINHASQTKKLTKWWPEGPRWQATQFEALCGPLVPQRDRVGTGEARVWKVKNEKSETRHVFGTLSAPFRNRSIGFKTRRLERDEAGQDEA